MSIGATETTTKIQNEKYQHNQTCLLKVIGAEKRTWKVLISILNKQTDDIVCSTSRIANKIYEEKLLKHSKS